LDALRTGWNATPRFIAVTDRRWGLGRRGEVARQGFDSRPRPMRGIHLASCAAAFRGGNCDLTQITLSRPA
jgi:cyclopropane-fatty-acyl-phospholipid synthase